jgi:hypothetical protein
MWQLHTPRIIHPSRILFQLKRWALGYAAYADTRSDHEISSKCTKLWKSMVVSEIYIYYTISCPICYPILIPIYASMAKVKMATSPAIEVMVIAFALEAAPVGEAVAPVPVAVADPLPLPPAAEPVALGV